MTCCNGPISWRAPAFHLQTRPPQPATCSSRPNSARGFSCTACSVGCLGWQVRAGGHRTCAVAALGSGITHVQRVVPGSDSLKNVGQCSQHEISVCVCTIVCVYAFVRMCTHACACEQGSRQGLGGAYPLSRSSPYCRSKSLSRMPPSARTGFILDGLTAPPLNHSFEALASEALASHALLDGRSLQQQDCAQWGSNAKGPSDPPCLTVQDLAEAVKHSTSTRVLAQFQAWESKQGDAGPSRAGSAPGTNAGACGSSSAPSVASTEIQAGGTLKEHGKQAGRGAVLLLVLAARVQGRKVQSAAALLAHGLKSSKEGLARAWATAGMQDYRAWVTAQVSVAERPSCWARRPSCS